MANRTSSEHGQRGFLSGCIENQYRRLSESVKTAFFVALIAGFVIHIASITGFIVNWDSLVLKEGLYFLISQGKWFTPVLVILRDFTMVGSIDGVLEIIWLAITCALLVDILRIKTRLYAGMLSLTMAAMPSVMCMNSYPAEDTFMISLFLAVLAVYLVERVKHGLLWGIIAVAFSLGIYQAYIGFTAGIFVILCLITSLENETDARKTVIRGCKYILVLVAGTLLYYLLLKTVLALLNVQLSTYRGISDMGQFSIASIATSAVQSYKAVLDFMLFDRFGFGGVRATAEFHAYDFLCEISMHRCAYIYPLLLTMTVCLLFCLCRQNKLFAKSSYGNLTVAVCMLLLLPLAVHAVGVLAQNSNTHWIMKYPFVLLFILPIKLLEMMEKPEERIKAYRARFALQICTAAICVLNVFSWFLITNQGYAALKIAYEGAYNTCVQIADDVAELPEFALGLPVYVAGKPTPDEQDAFSEFDDQYTGITDRNFLFHHGEDWHVGYMLKNYLGLQYNTVDSQVGENIKNGQEFQDMPSFPARGYIAVIDDVIVVKTGPNQ